MEDKKNLLLTVFKTDHRIIATDSFVYFAHIETSNKIKGITDNKKEKKLCHNTDSKMSLSFILKTAPRKNKNIWVSCDI